jgi:hypothetical protein
MSKLFRKAFGKHEASEVEPQKAPQNVEHVQPLESAIDAVSAAAAGGARADSPVDARLVAVISAAIAAFESQSSLGYRITSIIPVQASPTGGDLSFNTPIWGRVERLNQRCTSRTAQHAAPHTALRTAGGGSDYDNRKKA